jgi:glyoxylase-like metal-dependent hydrolase (beta-lactamase superfamily II)
MTAIRKTGRINNSTYLIDAVHQGIEGGFAVYLLKSQDGKSCLIDAGTKYSAPIIYERLKELGGWPVDMIIITHSHWDHSQGTGFFREKAAKAGHSIEVAASEKAIPYLKDQSYNAFFEMGQDPYLDIEDVKPLKDGEEINLGEDIVLKIFETPGHMVDHISILDRSNRNIFVGDAIGMRWADGFTLSNPNSPHWNEEDFYRTIDLLKGIDYDTLCLSHFGCLVGDEAKEMLDAAVSIYRQWMEIFAENRESIGDVPFLVRLMWEKVYNHIPVAFREILNPGLTEAVELATRAYVYRVNNPLVA